MNLKMLAFAVALNAYRLREDDPINQDFANLLLAGVVLHHVLPFLSEPQNVK